MITFKRKPETKSTLAHNDVFWGGNKIGYYTTTVEDEKYFFVSVVDTVPDFNASTRIAMLKLLTSICTGRKTELDVHFGMVKEYKMDITSDVRVILEDLFSIISMDTPFNIEYIVEFIAREIQEAPDPIKWTDADVIDGLRKWIEYKN